MSIDNRWLLPDGVEEIVPPDAVRLEQLRRSILDLYYSWGYDLVFPPLIEYLESLQFGVGKDLDLQTFKITDQVTGRTLGIRPDITPQVSRIVSHHFKTETPVRLCYAGAVLHAQQSNLTASRNLIQIGLELYSSAGIASDYEVLGLMLRTLELSGCTEMHLDLGHVGIFKGLMAEAQLTAQQEELLIDIYHRKAVTELEEFLANNVANEERQANLRLLEKLAGGEVVLARARQELQNPPAQVLACIDQLEQIARRVSNEHPSIKLYFDLSEIHGYNYHTGLVFAAYVSNRGDAVARGGRYDCFANDSSETRSATGFSTDLKVLAEFHESIAGDPAPAGIYVPVVDEEKQEGLNLAANRLRAEGRRVVAGLPGDNASAGELGCSQQLVLDDDKWVVADL